LESEVTQDNDASRLEASSDTGYPPMPQSAAGASRPADSPPFIGFSSPPGRSRYRPRLYPHPEEAEEGEESSEEGEPGGDNSGGARGGFSESHPVNPVHSGIASFTSFAGLSAGRSAPRPRTYPTAVADPPRRIGLGRVEPPARGPPDRPAAATRAAPASDPRRNRHRLPALAEPPANPSGSTES